MTTFEGRDDPEQAHDSRDDKNDPHQSDADNRIPKTGPVIILRGSQTARDQRPEGKKQSECSKQRSFSGVARSEKTRGTK